ncbi:unnamed protein product [Closterium sp. Naga37s-1]|nr:unnamed protein product [Closterium sp. Naga37s-1]
MKNDPESPEWDVALDTPFFDCWKICKMAKADLPQIKYWQYEKTCDVGGVCSCYDEGVCTQNHYNPDNTMDFFFDSTNDYQPPSEFFVGKVCDGNVTGDPHFVGADKSRFDFSGQPSENFALISDAHIAVNAYFGGRVEKEWMGQKNKVMTWMRNIAILWGHHSVVFEARPGADSEYGAGYLKAIYVDGEKTSLSFPGEKMYLFDGSVELKWVDARKKVGDDLVDIYEISVAEIITLRLILRPEIKLMRTKNDGLVHFTIEVVSAQLSANVHGVLGQTYRPDFAGRLEKQTLVWSKLLKAYVVPGDNAEGFIDGTWEDYKTSELMRSDCNYCRFVRGTAMDDETASAVAMATSVSSSYSSLGRKGMIDAL